MKERIWSHIHSVFDIAGKNELGLTRAFGVILRKDKTLFNNFLRLVLQHPPSISKALFSKTEFFFEKSHRQGRTDIEIVNDEIHVIIESKIGTNRIRFKQADRYCNKLSSSISKHKCFVFLTEIGNIKVDQSLERKYPNIKFGNCSWKDTLGLFNLRKKIIVNLVQEYESYLLEAQEMKIYDIDIWAVSVTRKQQVKNFDKWNFYINNKRHSPIFIAKRQWDSRLKRVTIKELRPVIKIHDPDSPKGRQNGKNYVYDLGRTLKLQKPIIKRFSQASAISVSFNDI